MSQRRVYQDEFPYFVTTNTRKRKEFFNDIGYARLLYGIILKACKMKNFLVYAFCIMPDHLHLLVEKMRLPHRTLEKVRWGGEEKVIFSHFQSTLSSVRVKYEYNISDLMQSIKGNFSRQIHIGNIWQPRFNSRIIDNDESLQNILEYIENNPINTGLPRKYNKHPYMYFNWKLIYQLF